MTCNPFWPEITAELLLGQTVQDHPELVSRVFKLKLNAILHDLTKKKVFGTAITFIYIIEFQKCSLPHTHILIILNSRHKPHTPTDIDSMVCAEIPNEATHPA